MVDEPRVQRLLLGIEQDVQFLSRFAGRNVDELLLDDVAVSGIKYRFVTAIEGCAKVAHHLAASEGWPVAETNADAVRQLGAQGVLTRELARSLADAVGFRNLLVHRYSDIDDTLVLRHLRGIGDLQSFTASVARWLDRQGKS